MRLRTFLVRSVLACAISVALLPASIASAKTPSDPKLSHATVRLDDLGTGWFEGSDDISGGADESDEPMEFCGLRLAAPVSLNASSFSRGDPTGPLFSYAMRLPPNEARAILTALKSKLAKGCTKTLDSGLEDVSPISYTYRLRKVPLLGDQSIGFQTTKQSLFAIKAVLFRKGDVLVVVSSAPTVNVDRIAAKVAARL